MVNVIVQQENDVRAWQSCNRDRIVELNDALDTCRALPDRRILYGTLSREEKLGIMDEYIRRRTNETAPVGSLVRPRRPPYGFSITVRRQGSVTYASHHDLATVVGAEDGTYVRYVFLNPPWTNVEGHVIAFAEANAYDLEVVCTCDR